MKKITLCWLILFSVTLLLNISCTEDPPVDPTTYTTPPKQPSSAPTASAGADQFIQLPTNNVILNGSGSSNKNIITYLWTKITGPTSFTITTPNTAQTAVAVLSEGIYQFELTVTDSEGKSAKDICTITVLQNTPPNTYAGEDSQVILPTDFCWLNGSYYDNESIKNIAWKKTSGPSTYILESPNSNKTKVSNLGKGVYEFELTITDNSGLTSKDIAIVTVGEISENPNEKIFNNLIWECPLFGCQLEIKNIYSYIPPGSVFRVYVQRDNSVNWVEAFHWSTDLSTSSQYDYTLFDGNLYVGPYNYEQINETPNIKIVY